MEKIVEYLAISGKADALVDDVNKRIADGFEPLGGVAIRPSPEGLLLLQAMVKKAWDNTPPEFRAAMGR